MGSPAVGWRRSFSVRRMMPLRRSRCTMKSNRDAGRGAGRMSFRASAAPSLLLVLGVVMAGCSGGSGGATGGSPAASGSSGASRPAPSTSAPAPSASLELASPKSPPAGANTYTGVLRSDAIEGGCVYLQTADGQKYEVIPPEGWELQKAPAAVVSPGGQVVAKAGDVITVRGNEADMMSICQIGPIIQATDIVRGR